MLRSVGQPPVTERGEDPRLVGLGAAVAQLRRELAGYQVEFRDRAIAEDELAALAAMVADGAAETARMRRSLLLVVGSIGSVSALRKPLMEVRNAVDLFGDTLPPPR